MSKETQIKTLIEYFRSCETVTFSMKNIGESTFKTVDFRDTIVEFSDLKDDVTSGRLVEVVRCKHCKYGGDYECHHKKGLKFYKDDDYCSYGVRE